MPHYERLSLLVALTALGIGAALFMEAPIVWVLGVVIIAIVCGGTEELLRSHPAFFRRGAMFTPIFWIIPALLVAGGSLFLLRWRWAGGGWVVLVLGLALVSGLLALALLAEYHTIDPRDSRFNLSRLYLHLAAYLAALSLFIAAQPATFSGSQPLPPEIHGWELPTLVSVFGVGVVAALLCFELFREEGAGWNRNWLFSVVVGFLVAELAWALSYWSLEGTNEGFVLLLAFYFGTGIIQDKISGRLTRNSVLEFLGVGGAGLLALMAVRFWLG